MSSTDTDHADPGHTGTSRTVAGLIAAAAAASRPVPLRGDNWAGGVGAAILTTRGNVYTGACIEVSCSMGFCAEHAAAAAMVTAGESAIDTVVAVRFDGDGHHRVLPPCGRCREFMAELDAANDDATVILPAGRRARLADLLPEPWRPTPR